MSHRNRRITIVYCRIEFVTWISSTVAWNLSCGYRLSPYRICHVDIVYRHIVIVYCHIVIVYRCIDVVTCSSSHSTTFRATVTFRVAKLLTDQTASSRQSVLVHLYCCFNNPKYQLGKNLVCPIIGG